MKEITKGDIKVIEYLVASGQYENAMAMYYEKDGKTYSSLKKISGKTEGCIKQIFEDWFAEITERTGEKRETVEQITERVNKQYCEEKSRIGCYEK